MLGLQTWSSSPAMSLSYHAQFDIVTAARTLQWVAEPGLATSKMKAAAKLAGIVVVLDYDHAKNEWEPNPPAEFRHFYQAFLAWRDLNRWDNEMGSHLPELFQSAGLTDVQSHAQDEIVERGEQEFSQRSALWLEVIENIGDQLAKAGFCTQYQLQMARECYRSWIELAFARTGHQISSHAV
jgi:hypothetical protein